MPQALEENSSYRNCVICTNARKHLSKINVVDSVADAWADKFVDKHVSYCMDAKENLLCIQQRVLYRMPKTCFMSQAQAKIIHKCIIFMVYIY